MYSKINYISTLIDKFSERVGASVAWLTLALVLVQFSVVILRYVFSIGFIPMQEAIWYMHGMIFTLGASYTLLHDGHVRVDIFYRGASVKSKAWVDFLGVIFLLFPVCLVAGWISWSYVANAWEIKEGSMETSGLPYVYLLKGVILVFLILLFTQGISMALKSFLVLHKEYAK